MIAKQIPLTKLMNRALRLALSLSLFGGSYAAQAARLEAPVLRGPGVSQEDLEAYAEAQGLPTLSDFLDLQRPGAEPAQHLNRLVERAQASWLAGSVDAARAAFREIAKLALDADWREPQREAIHYSILRLAQSAPTPTEKEEWLERAVRTFPDLALDPDLFPPPIVDAFRSVRTRLLTQARSYAPFEHFPDARFLFINGKKFVLTPELKIRLPQATYRVTAISDVLPPISEKLSLTQIEVFKVSTPRIASGTCDRPQGGDTLPQVQDISILYSPDCSRTRTSAGWQPLLKEAVTEGGDYSYRPPTAPSDFPLEMNAKAPSAVSKRTWLWIGVTALVAGAAAVVYRQTHKSGGTQQEVVEPVSRQGFK